MLNYMLVKNRQYVFLGPIGWKQRFIQAEIDDLVDQGELSARYEIPLVEVPYIDLGDGFEIMLLKDSTIPAHNALFSELVGPFYIFSDDGASESYTIQDLSLDRARENVKARVALKRYQLEASVIEVSIAGGVLVSISTAREDRPQYTNLLATISDTTIDWKFGSAGFVSINATDVATIVEAINAYVQTQFNWEKGLSDQIDAASTIVALQAIEY